MASLNNKLRASLTCAILFTAAAVFQGLLLNRRPDDSLAIMLFACVVVVSIGSWIAYARRRAQF